MSEITTGPGRKFLKYGRRLELMCVTTPWHPSEKAEALWATKDFSLSLHYLDAKTAIGSFLNQ
ncbi:hypothetical protein BDV29DRAFT_176079 [Aspergillus leporis]|jgi:hypothetical protein|uniref:Uncharacterized protein n=1 Tax=Aspergillus leporis TaxID=41062 RepID=A0A5N5WZG6_9EURO|nr:hypothetical protein BDV29DRAFT_176079 [Aspergillus leporis]